MALGLCRGGHEVRAPAEIYIIHGRLNFCLESILTFPTKTVVGNPLEHLVCSPILSIQPL